MIPFSSEYLNIRQSMIGAVPQKKPATKEEQMEKRGQANQIIGGIFLGNAEKFVETTGQTCKGNAERGRVAKLLDTSNPEKFECVISLVPNWRMRKQLPDLDISNLPKELAERKIEWLQLGDALPDDERAWFDLAYNATFPKEELLKFDREFDKREPPEELKSIREEKKRIINELSKDKWFEEAFKKLDEAVLTGKKTLVHCLYGRSRSALFLGAYLINRFKLTSSEAIQFLQSKRYCVRIKCRDDLKNYANELTALRRAELNKGIVQTKQVAF